MELIVRNNKVTIKAPGARDQVKKFDDVSACLEWTGEQMQLTGAVCRIFVSDVALLLVPDHRAAFGRLYKGALTRSVSFVLRKYNGPIYKTVLAFWFMSQPEEWRNEAKDKMKALNISLD